MNTPQKKNEKSLSHILKKDTKKFLIPAVIIFTLAHFFLNFLSHIRLLEKSLDSLLHAQITAIEGLYNEKIHALIALKGTINRNITSDDELNSQLSNFQLSNLTIIDPTGRVISSSDNTMMGRDYFNEILFLRAKPENFILPISYDKNSKKLTSSIAVPFNFPQDRNGLLLGEINISEISYFFSSTPCSFSYNSYVFSPPHFLLQPIPGFSQWKDIPEYFIQKIQKVFLRQSSKGLNLNPKGSLVYSVAYWYETLNLAVWIEVPIMLEEFIHPGDLFLLMGIILFFILYFYFLNKNIHTRLKGAFSKIEKYVEDINTRKAIPVFPLSSIAELDSLARNIESIYKNHFESRSSIFTNESYFSRLVEHSSDYIVVAGFDGKIAYASSNLMTTFQIKESDILGIYIYNFVNSTSEKWYVRVNQLMNGEPFLKEKYTIEFNGVKVILDSRFSLLPGLHKTEPQIVINARNITEQEQLMQTLAKKDKMTSIFQFSAGVAHDFSNLLMGMLGHLSLAQLMLEQGEGKPLEEIQSVQKEMFRARELITSLMSVSRGGIFHFAPLDLHSLILTTWELFSPNKHLFLQWDWKEKLMAETDKEKTLSVFEEIFNNAVYFMGGRGIISVTGQIVERTPPASSHKVHKWIQVSIIDCGPGMNAEQLARVFEPYYSTRGTGRGLGLAMVYSVMEAMGGFVEIDSKIGLGTTVMLYFKTS